MTTKEYYHVTTYDNLDGIRQKGLVPSIGKRSMAYGETHPAIYLFANINDTIDAITNWLGDELTEDDDIMLLIIKITIPNDFDFETTPDNQNIAEYEILSYNPISTKYLSFYDENLNPIQ